MKIIRRAILWVFHRYGYDVIRPDPNPRGFNARHLATICKPKTVFDVGVADGTPELYAAYPKAKFVLVEPVREYQPQIDKIMAQYDCRVFWKAAGSQQGEAEITVDVTDPQKSSLETRATVTKRDHKLEKRKIEITTLDSILRECGNVEGPILVKIDTEGHELDTLKGATELLRRADFVIAEVSVAPKRFEGGYAFEDVVMLMRDAGYRVADILSIAHAPDELEPHHMDVVFKKVGAEAATVR
jgi:FkbM family methyltransferase